MYFQLLEKLGEGSYGSVYKAQAIRTAFGGDVNAGEIVAIKIVPVEKEQDELLNEINILEQCKSVYITRYFGSYMKDEDCWIVMEFCGAGSVNDIMVSAGITLEEDIIAIICACILYGLNYLHTKQVCFCTSAGSSFLGHLFFCLHSTAVSVAWLVTILTLIGVRIRMMLC